MKKLTLAAAIAGSLIAAPAIAETKADPFVSTQGAFGAGMAAIAATTLVVIIAATDGT